MDTSTAIARAIEIAGTQANLARRSGVSQQNISKLLLRKGAKPSIDTAIKLARATDGKVTLGDFIPALVNALDGAESRLGLSQGEDSDREAAR